jgi:hypothetical protein
MMADPLPPEWREKVERAAALHPIWSPITPFVVAEARRYLSAGLDLGQTAVLLDVMKADLDLALWRSVGVRPGREG